MPEPEEVLRHLRTALFRVDGAYWSLRHLSPPIALDLLGAAVTSLTLAAERSRKLHDAIVNERNRLGSLHGVFEEELLKSFYDSARIDFSKLLNELDLARQRLLTLYKRAATE